MATGALPRWLAEGLGEMAPALAGLPPLSAALALHVAGTALLVLGVLLLAALARALRRRRPQPAGQP